MIAFISLIINIVLIKIHFYSLLKLQINKRSVHLEVLYEAIFQIFFRINNTQYQHDEHKKTKSNQSKNRLFSNLSFISKSIIHFDSFFHQWMTETHNFFAVMLHYFSTISNATKNETKNLQIE
jgi:hypothetical protein